MTRVVRLEDHRRLQVIPGAPTIESATGLPAAQILQLSNDDKTVIFEAMKDHE